MNNELIERIELELRNEFWDEETNKTFTDCKAEIERLTIENANYVQALKCIKELEAKQSLDAPTAEIDAIPTFARGTDVADSLYLSQILNTLDKWRTK